MVPTISMGEYSPLTHPTILNYKIIYGEGLKQNIAIYLQYYFSAKKFLFCKTAEFWNVESTLERKVPW